MAEPEREEEEASATTDWEYPNPAFIADVMSRAPAEPFANVLEGRVLLVNGYTYIDVRTKAEFEEGHVRGTLNIPLINATKRWDADLKDYGFERQRANRNFVRQVEAQVPNKRTPIMVGCSDGRLRTIPALLALDEAGYEVLIGVRGGFMAWSKYYDERLDRKPYSVPVDKVSVRDEVTWISWDAKTTEFDSPTSRAAPTAPTTQSSPLKDLVLGLARRIFG